MLGVGLIDTQLPSSAKYSYISYSYYDAIYSTAHASRHTSGHVYIFITSLVPMQSLQPFSESMHTRKRLGGGGGYGKGL